MSQTTPIQTCNNTSVGILVWSVDHQFVLLQHRAKPPYGVACPAGHVEENETYEAAAKRELFEETGLEAVSLHLVLEETFGNPCRRPNGTHHHWKVYEATVQGHLTPAPSEVQALGWYSLASLQGLSDRADNYALGYLNDEQWLDAPGLELVWQYMLSSLGLVSRAF